MSNKQFKAIPYRSRAALPGSPVGPAACMLEHPELLLTELAPHRDLVA